MPLPLRTRKILGVLFGVALAALLIWYADRKSEEQAARELQDIPPEEFADSPVLNAPLETFEGTVVRVSNETMVLQRLQERTVGDEVFVEMENITALFTSATLAYQIQPSSDGSADQRPISITDVARGDSVIVTVSEDTSQQAMVRIVTLYVNAY